MSLNFEPQFHKKITQKGQQAVWVALPHPRTVIPVKVSFYRMWQSEERLKLQETGDLVLTQPV